MSAGARPLGVGIGWRPEIDLSVERLPGVDFVEVIAENVRPDRLPASLRVLRERGTVVIPHGVGLGLGGAHPPDPRRLAHLAACATALDAPLVSDHIAFVRAGGIEAGHLLPVPRTRACLDVVVDNVRRAQAALPVPLALENVAALLGWPDDDLTEGEFLAELVERTGVGLLVDVANLHTNHVNQGLDPVAALARLPLEALAYVHVAGGMDRGGLWHDTHTRAPGEDVLALLGELCTRRRPPGVLLEWDGDYPSDRVLSDTLARIRHVTDSHAAVSSPRPPRPPALVGASVGPAVAQPAQPIQPEPPEPPEPPELAERRRQLAERQTQLLTALLRDGPPPPGFPRDRLAAQTASLRAKHRRHHH
ncbi:DUF692 domain-containing protein [Streptomyces sp. 4N509B]|uniref:DUF692 domain-containing protein n=1 Tax=Streptomyces sp. 4N509B TaxID=3457413 RepID=UPI003FD21E72